MQVGLIRFEINMWKTTTNADPQFTTETESNVCDADVPSSKIDFDTLDLGVNVGRGHEKISGPVDQFLEAQANNTSTYGP